MKTLKLAYLFPNLLNSFGDRGNILAIKKRCEWRNINIEITEINDINQIEKNDMYYIGGNPSSHQVEVAQELNKKRDFFLKERDEMAVFLATCGGYQIIGKTFQVDNSIIEGLNLLDITSKNENKRFVGNVTIQTDLLTQNTIVGFENHKAITNISDTVEPLGKILVGNGNNGIDKTEGAHYKNVFGTYLQGALLPNNPHLTDYLIELALGAKPEEIEDSIETLTHNSLVNKKY